MDRGDGVNPTLRPWVVWAVVFTVGLGVLIAATIAWAPSLPIDTDSRQFLALGQSLAGGHGYKDTYSFWPDRPAYDRMPGWPALLAVALRLAPWADSVAVLRFANAFCLALAGVCFSALTGRLGGSRSAAVFAGLAVSLSPKMVYSSIMGDSEICFVLLVALGMNGILAGGRYLYLGAAALGMGALVRTNFAIVPFVFLCLACALPPALRAMRENRRFARLLLACLIATTPSLLWAVRNYFVSGRFPLLSSLEGETLYGSNNEVVANDLKAWGSWIVPNFIPGETSKRVLAKTIPNDLALNDYYHDKAISWIKGHFREMPRLVLGKLVRGFVPVPWEPLTPSFVAFGFRFLLYAAYLALLPFWRSKVSPVYLLLCLSIFLVQVATVVVYYGVSRMTHTFVEVFFVPCIFLGLQEYWRTRRRRRDDGREASQPPLAPCVQGAK
jgi:hypothetical protein